MMKAYSSNTGAIIRYCYECIVGRQYNNIYQFGARIGLLDILGCRVEWLVPEYCHVHQGNDSRCVHIEFILLGGMFVVVMVYGMKKFKN
jgi:hypothetical protein